MPRLSEFAVRASGLEPLRGYRNWAVFGPMVVKAPRARGGALATSGGNSFDKIRRVVKQIPRGRVMTYGDVAAAAGMPGAARTVGYAMRALGRDVPWQRVLGRRDPRSAHITIRDGQGKAEQRRLLEREGVGFDARGGVRLAEFGWWPPRRKPPSKRG